VNEDGWWETVVPISGGDLLPVVVRTATSGRYLTLAAPLAVLVDTTDPALLVALLRRPLHADHTDGAGYTVVADESGDLVAATYHWVLPSISPPEFAELLKVFARAVRTLRQDLEEMAGKGAPLRLLDPVPTAELAGGGSVDRSTRLSALAASLQRTWNETDG
jgi:hypothetical protein